MKDAVIIMADIKPYKIEIDGRKKTMRGCVAVGAYDGNEFIGTMYDSGNECLGDVHFDKKMFSDKVKKFSIIRGEYGF